MRGRYTSPIARPGHRGAQVFVDRNCHLRGFALDQNDKQFMNTFAAVLGLLAIFGVVFFFIAGMLSEDIAPTAGGPEAEARIAPVGSVRIAGEVEDEAPAAPAASAAPAAAAEPMSGDQVYTKACFACHGTGAAGAPKVGDAADWSARASKGMEAMVQNAIKGFQGSAGVMPPKGGHPYLSDDDIKAAVDYMMAESS